MWNLYTSRYANKALNTYDGTLLGITRSTPRWQLGYSFIWVKALAPDGDMWGKDHATFESMYRAKLARIGVDGILQILSDAAGVPVGVNATLVLLCFEDLRVDPFCHRRILATWLEEQTGIPVPELDNDPSPPKPRKTESGAVKSNHVKPTQQLPLQLGFQF